MKKRGLSTVVTSLIMILLVLVAVGIIWIVIKNIITSSTEQMTLGRFTLDLSIKDVKFNGGAIDVKVKREIGEGELSGIKFVVSDGVEEEVFEEPTTMKELGSRVFPLAYSGLVKEVSIAPIFETESGKEFTGNEIDKFKFSDEEVVKNINGLISWWRFEGDATDEVGNNHGTLSGGVDCNVDGKYGKGCEFDATNQDHINVGNNQDLNPSEITVSAWVYLKSGASQYNYIISNSRDCCGSYNGIDFGFFSEDKLRASIWNSTRAILFSNSALNVGQWHHGAFTYDGTLLSLYINGKLDATLSSTLGIGSPSSYNMAIGGMGFNPASYNINGTIDEVMIFNKALSEDEVKALYELELS